MLRKLRPRSAYDVMAAIAFFIAVAGGSAYAAATIGSPDIKNDAVLSRHLAKGAVNNDDLRAGAVGTGKVIDGSLLNRDFKAGQLPSGPPGDKGDKGDPCLASDPSCRGPKGDTGARGPGAISINTTFPRGEPHIVTTINGMDVWVWCDPASSSNPTTLIYVRRVDTDHEIYGWGFSTINGAMYPMNVQADSTGEPSQFQAGTTLNRLQFNLVAGSAGPGEGLKYTSYNLDALAAGGCNIHGVIIPPS
jgi:hypothetical protein